MQRLKILVLLLGVLAAGVPGAARAQLYCNNTLIGGLFFGFTAISVTSLAFSPYSPAAPSASQSNVTITAYCTGGLVAGGTLPPFQLSMSQGGGSFVQRHMSNGSYNLNYQIYTSASLATVWGDGSGVTSTVNGGNNNQTSQMITGYGIIPPGQYVAPGSYMDTITVTISY